VYFVDAHPVEDVMGIQKVPCQTVNWAFWILEVSVLKKRWKKKLGISLYL
jgi:hypothetical protein